MAEQKIYIIAGGHVDDEFIKKQLCDKKGNKKKDVYIIAVDKGLDCLYRLEINPDEVIGDLDSVSNEARIALGLKPIGRKKVEVAEDAFTFDILPYHIRQLDPVKDQTDTEEAIRFALRYFKKCEMVILGATGTRVDHMLGNIGILGLGLMSGYNIVLMDEHNKVQLLTDEITISKKKQFGDFVSVMPYTDDAVITMTGFKYNVDNEPFKKHLSLGVSNEIVDAEATIKVEEGIAILIEARD